MFFKVNHSVNFFKGDDRKNFKQKRGSLVMAIPCGAKVYVPVAEIISL